MAWYKEWFGQEYLELYAHRDRGEAERHIDFIIRELDAAPSGKTGREVPQAVLDLACGAGRHTQALRSRGYRTLGLDLSLTLLREPPLVPAVAGDMCCLPFADRSFDWVLNFFTSFGYFEGEEENLQVLHEISRVLRPQGRFLIDLFNIDRVLSQLKKHERKEMGGQLVEIERWYDPRTRRVNKRIRLHTPKGKVRVFVESVRAYREEEVAVGLEAAGLELERRFGSFAGDPFQEMSERLILIGRRVG